MTCPDTEYMAHRRNLPDETEGTETYFCKFCNNEFKEDQLYFAQNGDGCCTDCREQLDREERRKFQ